MSDDVKVETVPTTTIDTDEVMIKDVIHNMKMIEKELNEYVKLKEFSSKEYRRKCKRDIIKCYDLILQGRNISNTMFSNVGIK